jgi:hypothetical protein
VCGGPRHAVEDEGAEVAEGSREATQVRAHCPYLNCCLPFLSCFVYNPKCRQADCSACHLLTHRFLAPLILRP